MVQRARAGGEREARAPQPRRGRGRARGADDGAPHAPEGPCPANGPGPGTSPVHCSDPQWDPNARVPSLTPPPPRLGARYSGGGWVLPE